jgi:pre-rRNA-processing protein TSR3
MHYPQTVIVRHFKERTGKCTVWPLRQRADVLLVPYPVRVRPDLTGYIRLAAEGPALSVADVASGLLLLDGSWRYADAMTREFLDVPARSLSGWKTAYPRVSRWYDDPDNGLSSVEALYVAYHLLGRPTAGLFEAYRWGDEFLRLNAVLIPPGAGEKS